mgnify:CR=1 FL=1
MRPEYGPCETCAAWRPYNPDHPEGGGMCKRLPETRAKGGGDGCYSYIGKLSIDAFAPTLALVGVPQGATSVREYKPSHEAMEDVDEKGEVET